MQHESLASGAFCPECEDGVVCSMSKPQVLVRVTGQAPLTATRYELERLRCNLCGGIFAAAPPSEVGPEKYDAKAAAMIALLKYGTGTPFHRLAKLQGHLGIPRRSPRSGTSSRSAREASSRSTTN